MTGRTDMLRQARTRARAVARLRKSKARYDRDLARRGCEAGQRWAMEVAEFVELGCLGDLAEADDLATRYRSPHPTFSPGERLYFDVCEARDGDRRAAAAFWDYSLNAESHLANDAAFVTGFALAAVAFLDEVKTEL
ncbi:MAG TPA: hypothetical protein VM487_03305 [Phycisphaerae bacterium]|nr:hypothetical protein [Phycisphaerae bacterium]